MKKTLSLLFLLTSLLCAQAQSDDCGSEWAASAAWDLGRCWQVDLGEELRLSQSSTHIGKSESSAGLSRSLWANRIAVYGWKVKAGAGYSYIWRYNSHHYYEPQQRIELSLKASKELGQWKLSSRTRCQTTWRDEARVEARYNPKMYLRQQLQVEYTLPGKPWNFFASEECFYRLNDPEGHWVDEWRTRIGAEYQWSRRSTLGLYFKVSQEVQVEAPETLYLLGVSYDFH